MNLIQTDNIFHSNSLYKGQKINRASWWLKIYHPKLLFDFWRQISQKNRLNKWQKLKLCHSKTWMMFSLTIIVIPTRIMTKHRKTKTNDWAQNLNGGVGVANKQWVLRDRSGRVGLVASLRGSEFSNCGALCLRPETEHRPPWCVFKNRWSGPTWRFGAW